MLVSLVTAADLTVWANRLDARARLPEVIRRLVQVTAGDITRLEMRAAEGTQYGGWDGIIEVGQGNEYVPTGLSVWELGVSSGVKTKANEDYEKRTKDPLGIVPAEAVYVFVTPRRWAGKEEWAAERRAEGVWRDVRVIDADNLEAWLALSLVVHAWLSSLLGKAPYDVQDLETFWEDWRSATIPPLSADLIIGGRDDDVARIIEHMRGEPGALTVRADSPEEALAFIAASFARLPEDERTEAFARALIVHNPNAWRQVALSEQPIILMPTFGDVETTRATGGGHQVLVPLGREIAETADMVSLSRAGRHTLEDALKSMGLPDEQSREMATLGRRSLLSLRRKLAANPGLQQPIWAHPENARAIIPAMLAGNWDEAVESDRHVIEQLSGHAYGDYVQELVRLANESDPPIRQLGSKWLLVSKDDAWKLLARFLTRQDVERYVETTMEVLGARDPALDLPIEDRWKAAVLGKSRAHSVLLREGLADTLALMATRSGDVSLGGFMTGQTCASHMAGKLLRQANEDAEGHAWNSLVDILPLLAEAAPEVFLESVDSASAGADPVVMQLFAETDRRSFTARSVHHYLLWALERLAWSPTHLGHAALLLARLARISSVDTKGDSPQRSLRAIFLPWHPQTAASLAERLVVIDMLREREPVPAWELMVSLLPQSHDTAFPTSEPRWREWKPEARQSMTYDEIWQAADDIVARLLDDGGSVGSRVADLVANVSSLPPTPRENVVGYLQSLDPSTMSDGDRKVLVDRIRREVSRHRKYPEAKGSMPSEQVDQLAEVYAKFQPDDPIERNAWLFTSRPELPDVDESDFEAHGRAVAEAQRAACESVYQSGGMAKIRELAAAVEHPWMLGWSLAQLSLPESDEDAVLSALGSSNLVLKQLALGYVASAFRSQGWEWADRKFGMSDGWTAEQLADLFKGLPSGAETWNRLDARDQEVQRLYWIQQISHVADSADVLRAVGQLLKFGRAWVALDMVAMYLHGDKFDPGADLVIEILENAISTPIADQVNQLLQYDVAKLFDYLNATAGIDESRLARVEWGFAPLFRFEHRPLRALHKELATNPEFFVEVLSVVFKRRNEEPREFSEETQALAEAAYSVLDSFRRVPGAQEDGSIDHGVLSSWVAEARRLLEAADRAKIGDQFIGKVLKHTKADAAGTWPPVPVRELLESVSSRDLELGIEIEVTNTRGMTSRGVGEGGAQERVLAEKYKGYAQAVSGQYPRTAAMLRRIADNYEDDARRYDREAELDEDRW